MLAAIRRASSRALIRRLLRHGCALPDDQPDPRPVFEIMQRASSGATAAFLPRARPASCTPCGSASRSTDDRRVCRHRRTASPRRRRRPASDNDAGVGRRDGPVRRWFPGADPRTLAVSVGYAKQKPPRTQIRCVARKSMGDVGHAMLYALQVEPFAVRWFILHSPASTLRV
jgi:hypothetical protein